MKVAFSTVKIQAPRYTTTPYSNKGSLNFKGDTFEKQESYIKTLENTYENLMARHKKMLEGKNTTQAERIELAAQMSRLTSQYAQLNDILNNSSIDNFDKDEKALLNYLLGLQNIGKNRGFNRIVGYNDIKDNLTNDFILKTMAKARTSQKTDVPNAFLFFGPAGCGKTTFAHALAENPFLL